MTENIRRSRASAAVEAILFAVMTKKRRLKIEGTEKIIARAKIRNAVYFVPPKYIARFFIRITRFEKREVCNFNFHAKKAILYLHGGAYMFQPLKFHYRFCYRLAEKTNRRVIMPIYPKTPTHNFEEIIDFTLGIYKELLREYKPEDIAFVGDSAGGSLALSAAMVLSSLGLPQPRDIIMMSPWLDVSMSNPELYDVFDPMLNIKDMRRKAIEYARGGDLADFRVSPLFGDCRDLGRLAIFVGGHELMLVDGRKLKKRLDEEKIPISYFEYPYMNHTFPLFPIPEAKRAMEEIAALIDAS